MKNRYTTYGPTRGGCGHEHIGIRDAYNCLEEELYYCGISGKYTDREVYALTSGGCRIDLNDEERERLNYITVRDLWC
jgi:hypothetical protein